MSGGNISEDPAAGAVQNFAHGDYATCLRLLGALPAADPRVEHNRSLAELFSDNTRGSERYRAVLAHLLGVTFPRGDVPAAAMRRPTLVYNYAVLLFHARYYRQAGDVLARLADERIEDPALRRRVALLLAETHLCRRAAHRALDVIKAAKKFLDKDCPDENALVSRLTCRARLILGESVEAGSVQETSVEGVVLSAHTYLARGDPLAAGETLARHATLAHSYSARTQGEEIWPALNNNLGVIHLVLNKPALAVKYFQTAVKEQLRGSESDRLCTVRDRPLYVYNLGLALLRAGRPGAAFDCLVEAARHYPANPLLWRRLADCCVRHAVPDSTAPPQLVRFGSGAHARLAITSPQKQEYSPHGESFAIPNLSLEFAALCLRNALTLMPARDTDEPTPAPPGAPLSPQTHLSLRHSALTLHSYVLLKLQDPLSALCTATEVLREATAPSQLLLAHLYSAEALIKLDRLQEAAEHLHPPLVQQLVSALPPREQDIIGVQVWATAAVCHILRGDLATARKILAQLDSPRVLPLQVYLETQAGNVEACHAVLRKIKYLSL